MEGYLIGIVDEVGLSSFVRHSHIRRSLSKIVLWNWILCHARGGESSAVVSLATVKCLFNVSFSSADVDESYCPWCFHALAWEFLLFFVCNKNGSYSY